MARRKAKKAAARARDAEMSKLFREMAERAQDGEPDIAAALTCAAARLEEKDSDETEARQEAVQA